MYFEVRINRSLFGVFGHPNVLSMNLSVMWVRDLDGSAGAELFANAVCMEGGRRYFYDWTQHPLTPLDVVEIVPTDGGDVPPPRNRYEMDSETSVE